MCHDLEIRHCARQMIEAHGRFAADHAELCAALLQATGDDLQAAIWRQIAQAVGKLQRDELPSTDTEAA